MRNYDGVDEWIGRDGSSPARFLHEKMDRWRLSFWDLRETDVKVKYSYRVSPYFRYFPPFFHHTLNSSSIALVFTSFTIIQCLSDGQTRWNSRNGGILGLFGALFLSICCGDGVAICGKARRINHPNPQISFLE